MVQVRYDDLAASLHSAAQCTGKVERERGHVLPECNLAGRGIQEVCKCLTSTGDGSIRLHTRRVGPVGVRVVMQQVARHGVHHGARNLGATGTIEVGHRMSRVNPLQGRELCADSRQKFGHWTGAKQVREVESGTLQQANHAHGHHPTLSSRVTEPVSYARRVGAFSATMMVVGGIIGSGIFLNPAIVAQRVGSPVLIMSAWAVGAAVALLGAFVFAELGQRMPATGGGYVYLRETFGRLPAFLYGWALLLAIATGAMAAVAVTFARYAAPL